MAGGMMTAILEMQRYTYIYPDGTPALRDISFQVDAGESVGIVGPNGAGKTTALLGACGLIEGAGTVRVRGEELGRKSYQLRSKLGFVFQNPDDQLFMPTVYEDIAFGPQNLGQSDAEVKQSVKQALEAVELPGFEEKSSHHLSSGEKKRIAIATVLSMDPEILLLDEPTTNLDPRSRRHLIELLGEMSIATLIAGHDLELLLELSDRVLMMNNGIFVEEGAPDTLFADEELMRRNHLEVPHSLRDSTPINSSQEE